MRSDDIIRMCIYQDTVKVIKRSETSLGVTIPKNTVKNLQIKEGDRAKVYITPDKKLIILQIEKQDRVEYDTSNHIEW